MKGVQQKKKEFRRTGRARGKTEEAVRYGLGCLWSVFAAVILRLQGLQEGIYLRPVFGRNYEAYKGRGGYTAKWGPADGGNELSTYSGVDS